MSERPAAGPLDDATVAAIGLALTLEAASPPARVAAVGGMSVWALAGRLEQLERLASRGGR